VGVTTAVIKPVEGPNGGGVDLVVFGEGEERRVITRREVKGMEGTSWMKRS
jgi:hypothetical protein